MAIGTIILVPGIGGNELSTPPSLFGLGPPLQIWLSPPSLIAGGWRLLGLSPDGITPDVPFTGPMVPGPALSSYYAIMSIELERMGWRVVNVRLDWRQTIARDGARLVDLVRQLAGDGPVHLVGHSRGGLVMRRALATLAGSGELNLVGRCIGLGVPHQGSWSAVGTMAGWVEAVLLLEVLLRQVPSLLIGGDPLGTVHQVVETWPAIYELFPRPSATGLEPHEWLAIYNPAGWAAIGLTVSTPWLAAAHLGWAALPEVPSSVQWADVVGHGLVTPQHLVGSLPPSTTRQLTWDGDGDGVVPVQWATQPGRLKILTPTSHGSLVTDGRVLGYLHQWLLGELTHDVTIGGGVLH